MMPRRSYRRFYTTTIELGAWVYAREDGTYPQGQLLAQVVEECIFDALVQEGLGIEQDQLVIAEEEFEEEATESTTP